jgi:hypothetical protein
MRQWLIGLGALLAGASAAAQPVLRYEPPTSFYRSAIAPPDDYSAKEFNASVQVYPFRAFNGSVEETFRRNLLRGWIEPRFQEGSLAAPPEIRAVKVAGAEAAFTARFVENIGTGLPRQHLRMLIVSGNTAALVDASAISIEAWEKVLPALNAMAATLSVSAGAPRPKGGRDPGAVKQ